ncbi:uncharacterized protein LOC110099134 [Dendrobium catenatum]|uniref:Uncharacterized protein n=1 Tax=Dendrobium catenatum TaxID=906689 RepID=A0A2I0X762_9ASPA|nr:uncharacterized protein LOC110099134 [Dendrobium catenatum]PKU83753.1 hypothetical protein MA16_Dca010146 [Dendrobium catenatum]
MAGKELNERVVSVQEGDGEVIDRELFDYFKENMEEGETKQPKQKPEVLVTVVNKINLNNGQRNEDEEKHGIYCYSNDEDDEIEEGGTEEQNEKKNMMNLKYETEDKMYAEQHKKKGDVKEMAIEEEDTNVEIERVAMEEAMWEEKMEGSLLERKEKKGFLKKIIEKWT